MDADPQPQWQYSSLQALQQSSDCPRTSTPSSLRLKGLEEPGPSIRQVESSACATELCSRPFPANISQYLFLRCMMSWTRRRADCEGICQAHVHIQLLESWLPSGVS